MTSSDGATDPAALAGKFLKDEFVADEEALRRFTGEVRILQQLEHPNIVNVVARNLSQKPPWFVMPLAASNLDVEIHDNGRAGDVDWVVEIFRACLVAMAYAHDRDVIHRDLKPENVLFIDGVPVISDFGLGRRLDAATTRQTLSAAAMGTFAYMAPEQYGDVKRAGAPADVYALGKILWEMLSGGRPQPLRPPNLDQIPGNFRHFVSRCCEDDPANRYPDAGEALAAFEVLTSTSAKTPSDPPMQVAEQLVQEWSNEPPDQDLPVLRRLNDHLTRYSDEEELYFELVPRLPRDLVEQYIVELPDAFAQMLAHYDDHITGGLPFAYCDVVADFYEFVFERAENPRVRRMIIARLLDVGASHNRWHVAHTLNRILLSIDDSGTDQLAAEAVAADPNHARWFLPYVEIDELPRLVGAAFRQLTEVPAGESSGFIDF